MTKFPSFSVSEVPLEQAMVCIREYRNMMPGNVVSFLIDLSELREALTDAEGVVSPYVRLYLGKQPGGPAGALKLYATPADLAAKDIILSSGGSQVVLDCALSCPPSCDPDSVLMQG